MELTIPAILDVVLQQLTLLPPVLAVHWGLLGLQSLWGTYGWWCLLALPLLPLLTVAAAKIGLGGLGVYLRRWETRRKATCAHCQTVNHPAAITCRSCREPLAAPVHVDALGLITAWPTTDLEVHRQHLLAAGRCPACAERLPQRTPRQRCAACGMETFDSAAARDRYLARHRGAFHSTVGICLAMSSIPILGLIPWVLYDAVSLPGQLRRYGSDSVGSFERLRLRVVVGALLMVQWVPILGAVSLPLICLVQCAVYGRALAAAPLRETAPAQGRAEPAGLPEPSRASF